MTFPIDRRQFVQRSLQLGALAGLTPLGFLDTMPTVSADEVRRVQLQPDIEPLVRLIEDAPRQRLLEEMAGRVRSGTSYGEILSALMLAGVRGIKPRPVGFKFHAVLVLNSAHQAALAASDRDRWLPLFWALDNYKASQERNRQEGGWVMSPPDESRLPTGTQARQRFQEAMDNWDVDGADAAITSFTRHAGANEVMETFWRYGARDFRDIGHKAIFVANGWRTIQTIGWRHAEPILRSLAFALLDHEGTNPAQRDADQDRPGRENLRRLTRIREGWQTGRVSADASRDLLATLRTASPAEASDRVVALLNEQIQPASIWDGLFLTSGELLMRQPGIVGLHTVTTLNALYYGYSTSANDETRRFLMLQGAAFLPMFRQAMTSRGRVGNQEITALEMGQVPDDPAQAIQEIFADVRRDNQAAARKTLAFVNGDPARAEAVQAAARRLIFTHGSDSHDYKFSSAVLEDFYHVTPALRDRYLAGGMFWLRGSGGQDTEVYRRTRAALGEA